MVPLLALLGLMLMSAQLNPLIDPGRRLLHLGLYVGLALAAAQGRFHTRSMAKGLGVGLLVSAAAYYAGYGTGYPGRLAGLMADPNAAGYILTTLGCLALAGLRGQPVADPPRPAPVRLRGPHLLPHLAARRGPDRALGASSAGGWRPPWDRCCWSG